LKKKKDYELRRVSEGEMDSDWELVREILTARSVKWIPGELEKLTKIGLRQR
jgi:hypothetical protein